jgi:hypothetical protein
MDSHLLSNLQETLSRSTTNEWAYLAEGGAHLVFAYRAASPLLSNKVLRIRKENIASSSSPSSTTGGSFEAARQYLASSVIPTLVPADLLPSEIRLAVEGKWARQLEQATLDVRPESRLSTPASSVAQSDLIDPGDDSLVEVSLVENLLGGEGDLAIEIKVSPIFSLRKPHIVLCWSFGYSFCALSLPRLFVAKVRFLTRSSVSL